MRVDIKDMNHIFEHTTRLWEDIRGQNIFITGGTGYFGCWLLETLTRVNDRLNLAAKATVLSRNPNAFINKAPHLANHPSVHLIQGDVRDFQFPRGEYRLVIHAATEASARLNRENPLLMFETIVEGTRRVLEFARTHGTREFLLTSSGAVYGEQPPEMTHIPEDYLGAPDPMDLEGAYGGGKWSAEVLCRLYAHRFGLETKIARCFAQIGPYLPLDIHYAIGNFIRDAMRGDPILVNGDGTPVRSYLYAADLAIWLWTILIKGQPCHPYNVGSERSISIAELADLVRRQIAPRSKVVIARQAEPSPRRRRYVPSIERARSALKLETWIPLEEAIKRTAAWLKAANAE
jgi:dTDP-glucose 4,6-dehydratase